MITSIKFTEEQRKRIIDALNARGAGRPCPRCGHQLFGVLDGYITHPMQLHAGELNIGGPSVPTAVVACLKCGWLAEHSLGILGLLPAEGGQQ